jgi:hypothetical protein
LTGEGLAGQSALRPRMAGEAPPANAALKWACSVFVLVSRRYTSVRYYVRHASSNDVVISWLLVNASSNNELKVGTRQERTPAKHQR